MQSDEANGQHRSPVNLFVFGDLVLDHLIPVTDIPAPLHAGEREQFGSGLPRKNYAGGAALTARLIASLSDGRTFLWGLSGDSRWGSFSHLLELSQQFDTVVSPIQYRASHS